MTHNEIPSKIHADSATKNEEGLKPWIFLNSTAADQAALDISQIEKVLKQSIRSSQSEPKILADRLIGSGGKRLRPYLLSLVARSLTQKTNTSSQWRGSENDLYHLAAVSELVHTATLFHDDVIDQSETRRGLPAAHILNGNKTAVLVGDFVYAEAFYVLMERGLMDPSRELAKTVKTIVDGELLQLRICHSRSIGMTQYLQIASAKTASLFAWCTGTGAWVAGSQQFLEAAKFGQLLGLAFQMADDLIDTFEINPFSASETELASWLDSAPSLPLVLAHEGQNKNKIEDLWKSGVTSTDVAEQRTIVDTLQQYCADASVVAASLKQVGTHLGQAQTLLQNLGIESEMSWTVQTIQARAQEGASASKFAGTKTARHGIF